MSGPLISLTDVPIGSEVIWEVVEEVTTGDVDLNHVKARQHADGL